MTTKPKGRKGSEMVYRCVCGVRFHRAADTLAEVVEAFSLWWQEHSTCKAAS